jgi:anti-anti-sigma factor
MRYLQQVIQEQHLFIAINFERIIDIDSAGIGVFAFALRSLKEKNGTMAFIKMNEIVEDVFRTTGVLEYAIKYPDLNTFKVSQE